MFFLAYQEGDSTYPDLVVSCTESFTMDFTQVDANNYSNGHCSHQKEHPLKELYLR